MVTKLSRHKEKRPWLALWSRPALGLGILLSALPGRRLLLVCALLGAGACTANDGFRAAGRDDGLSNVADDTSDEEGGSFALPACIDMDGDGFGFNCERGPDCDDTDPRVGSECMITPVPCEEGSPPQPCYKVMDLDGARMTCGSGVRYCQRGLWSHCQINQESTLPMSLHALITGPSTCNPCNPACFYTEDRPDALDITDQNSRFVGFDAAEGGVVLDRSHNLSLGIDTDGDGVPDMFDPFPDDPHRDGHTEFGNKFYVLPFQGAMQYDPYDIDLRLGSADIYFLMDTTSSMQGEIDNLTNALISGYFIENPEDCGVADGMPKLSPWVAHYYPNRNLSGSPSFSRLHEKIAITSAEGPPLDNDGNPWPPANPGINFSIRFTGKINVPDGPNGHPRIVIASDDGKRLFIDGERVPLIDSQTGNVRETWGWAGHHDYYALPDLSPGVHDIVLEYSQHGGGWHASARVHSREIEGYEGLVGGLRCTIPDSHFGLGYLDDLPRTPYGYDGDDGFCDDPDYGTPHDLPLAQLRAIGSLETAAQRADFMDGVAMLSAQCGFDIPESQLPALYAVATGAEIPNTLDASFDDVEHLHVTPWGIHEWHIPQPPPGAETEPDEVEPCLPPSQWSAAYFDNMTVSGTPVLTRTDSSIAFNWGRGSPDPSVPNDYFSARWRGEMTRSVAGVCSFSMRIDDGMRVRLNGSVVLASWRDQGATTYSTNVEVRKGINEIEVEYYENRGNAVAQFWVSEATEGSLGGTFDEPDFSIGDASQATRSFASSTTGARRRFSGGCGASSAVPDHIYQFEVTEQKRMVVSTVGSSFGVRLHLLDSTKNSIDCNNNNGNYHYIESGPAVIVRNLDPGTYYAVVDGNSGAEEGDYQLTIGPFEGDAEDDATYLGDLSGKWYRLLGRNNNFNNNYSDGSCWGGTSTTSRDNVLRFVVSRQTNLVVAAQQNELNVALRLYDENFRELYCNNGPSRIGSIFQQLDPGTYYLLIEGDSNRNGNYSVGIGEWPASQPVWTPKQSACTEPGAWGYPCFRDGTMPVVMLFTDAEMHNSVDGGGSALSRYDVNAPAINDAVHALRKRGIKVIGIHSGLAPRERCSRDCLERRYWTHCWTENYTYCAITPERRRECEIVTRCYQSICVEEESCRWVRDPCPESEVVEATRDRCRDRSECIEHGPQYCWMDRRRSEWDLRRIANATGTVDEDGEPLVYQISSNGEGLSEAVVQSVSRLANASRISVALRVRDNPLTPGVDERRFVKGISTVLTPLQPGDPEPLTNTRCIDVHETWYERCTPGTPIRFNLSLRNDFVAGTREAQTFTFDIDVVGDGLYVLKTFKVTVVVPPDEDLFPPEGRYWRVIDSHDACGSDPLISRLPDWQEVEFEAEFPAGTGIRWEAYLADTHEGLETATPYTWESPGASSPLKLGQRLVGSLDQRRRLLKIVAVLLSDDAGRRTPVLKSMGVNLSCRDEV